jgi:glutathione S-transferase|eukprot:g6040.t1
MDPLKTTKFSHEDRDDLNNNRGVEAIDPAVDGNVLRLCGGLGSPYTFKMMMYLRYRRIPFRFIVMHQAEERGTKHAKGPVLLPKLLWPDGSVMNDSTFLIRKLEADYPGTRSTYPPSATHGALRFLCHLLEDFGDEWLTKSMYHYRWVHDPGFAGRGIAYHSIGPNGKESKIHQVARSVEARQVDRLKVVGSNALTGPSIEAFFRNFVTLLDAHLAAGNRFLLGSRPSSADFAVLGQLHPMITMDPATSMFVKQLSPRVSAWYQTSLFLSGYSVMDEGKGWVDVSKGLPPTLHTIFQLVGRFYVPFMLANGKAYAGGKKEFTCTVDSGRVLWSQPTFRYQYKCLRWIRDSYNDLGRNDLNEVRKILRGTEILPLFEEARGRL